MPKNIFLLCLAALGLFPTLPAANIVSVRPLHEKMLLVHFDDGRVEFHGNGETWNQDRVFVDPIAVGPASASGSYRLSSTDDANYATARPPLNVARKTKPTEISGICDGWGRLPFYGVEGCLNANGDRALEHWLYLELPTALVSGNTYTLTVAAAVDGRETSTTFTWDDASTHSEALHVNNLGYANTATLKAGYLYHWAGDGGGVDFSTYTGQPFHLIATEDGSVAHSGTVSFRARATNRETNQNDTNETPAANFLGTAVWECDFSDFTTPGNYRLSVPGVGASFPFAIGCDALRPAYRATSRALYHNRSGIAKTTPYTTFTRPADHNPAVTPGFANRLVYSDFTICASDSPENSNKDKWEAGRRGSLSTTYGWYHDAGDWDAYASHLKIPGQLLFTYEFFADNFRDGDLNIPESGNGIPDLLDEAMWLPRFFQRLRAETDQRGWSSGGVGGARVFGDLWGNDNAPGERGRGSWQDNDRDWYVSGEDPVNTFAYAGMAAHIAWLLRQLNAADPEGIDWAAEAASAYAWAEARYDPDYACHEYLIAEKKNYAAAALYRLTEDDAYHTAYRDSWADMDTESGLGEDAGYGAYIYLSLPTGATQAAFRTAALRNVEQQADFLLTGLAETRATRYGGNPWLPMLVGHATTPWVFEGVMGYALLRGPKPAKAAAYYATLHSTADYFLGTNPLNMTWVTGLGERYPEQLFLLDAWHDEHEGFPAGYVPYGPWRRQPGFGNTGPWDIHWPEQSVHPGINAWPGHERWFGQQTAPLMAEFTVHQNVVNAAVLYGALSGPASCSEVTVSSSEAVESELPNLFVTPNPTSGPLRIGGDDLQLVKEIKLYDLTGRAVGKYAPSPELDLTGLEAGAYVLRFFGQGSSRSIKVVLK